MLTKILPILFLTLGLGAGVGAGVFFRPSGGENETEHDDPNDYQTETSERNETSPGEATEFIKLHSQFVVPVIRQNEISALVVMSLTLEAKSGLSDAYYAREPKLRDVFLQTLFDHANMGGFDGAFTSPSALDPLRNALGEVARKELGNDVVNVLITDLARQDS